jgi:hypothetical protein
MLPEATFYLVPLHNLFDEDTQAFSSFTVLLGFGLYQGHFWAFELI